MSNWPDNIAIHQYLEGTLDNKLMHQLEKKALEDPFLADALEGYAQTPHVNHGLSILQRQLQERIVHLQENKKVFDLSWQRLSIAAAAAVLFISAGILFWMNSNQLYQKTRINNKQTEVQLTHQDSLKNSVSKNNTNVQSGSVDNSDLNFNPELKNESAETKAVSGLDISDMPEPVGGWINYKKYITERVNKLRGNNPPGGMVKLNFTVDSKGSLSNFKITKSLTPDANALSIQIIKNGPLWKQTQIGKPQLVQLEIDFSNK